ncbi:MAG: hypothetical protein AAGK28_06760 [Pseudomonadota bacterium]
MVRTDLITVVGCAIFVFAGLAMIASNFGVVRDGYRLFTSDETVVVEIVEKKIERPARKPGVRGESISVNGTKVRSLQTYFNAYFALVSNTGSSLDAKLAPVSYTAWHAFDVGMELDVIVAPGVTGYADIAPGATLRYGLKQMALGFVIILLGVGVLFIPGEEDDQPNPRYS